MTSGTRPARRLAVRVTKDAERQIRGGHPWVFDESIVSVKPEGEPGDLAVIFDSRRDFLAIGLYDPASPIRVKVLHAGRPLTIDAVFWRARLDAALGIRDDLVADPRTTGYRCVHGENDGLPGLVLDRYGEQLVLKLYAAAWFPHLPVLVDVIATRLAPASIVLRLARNVARGNTGGLADGDVLVGDAPDAPVLFLENGLTFEADVVHGQKTGFFLDQRDNRLRISAMAARQRVLDVFSCTGGFSVSAAVGGAAAVHSVDISPGAIASAERNMAHNAGDPNVRACQHETTTGDAYEVMEHLIDEQRTFGVVVVDPPSFASRQSQVHGALEAYARLADLALQLVEPGGLIMQASCSSRVTADQLHEVVCTSAARRDVRLYDIQRTGHPVDHPIGFPQGEYLHAVFARTSPSRGR